MSIAPPHSPGRPGAILALPPDDAWPLPDELINRGQLAELYGVTTEIIRAWHRRGKGPGTVTSLKRGDFRPALYRVGEAKAWLEAAVAAQNEAAVAAKAARARKAKVDNAAGRPPQKIEAEPPSIPLNALVELPLEGTTELISGWHALDEDEEPFVRNERRPASVARYW